MKSVAVFFGGQSIEHEISIITGTLTVNSVDKTKYNPIPVFVDKDGKWYSGEILKDVDSYKNLDYKKLYRVTFVFGDNRLFKIKGKRLLPICPVGFVLNCMHGERGEDGTLAGVAKACNLALASPQTAFSSVCMSKSLTKIFLKGLNVKTLNYFCVENLKQVQKIKSKLTFPVIVKPDCGGSSIGITVVNDPDGLEYAVFTALRYGKSALIEQFLQGATEINCAVYKDKDKIVVSECEKPIFIGELLSFNDKYKDGDRVFPADIDKHLSDKIKQTTLKIYQNFDGEGVVRMDYLIKDGVVYLNEINTVPGSLSYYLFSEKLQGFTAMLNDILERANQNSARQQSYKTTFNSGILHGIGSKGAKRLKN
jgi:D-alanine-D-alanine ligase